MEDFYNTICITHSNPDIIHDVVHIQDNMDILFNIITYDFAKLAHISAKQDYTRAYLGLYSNTFTVNDDFIIHDYLFPSAEFNELLESYNISPIIDKLTAFFAPFTIHIDEIDDIFLIYIQWVNVK